MDEEAFLGNFKGAPLWCTHRDTISDGEGYAICQRCGTSFYDGPLRERDLIDACDAIARQAGCRTPSEMQLEEELGWD